MTVEGRFICDDMDYEAIDSDLTLDVSFFLLLFATQCAGHNKQACTNPHHAGV